ncbi:metallophosphoesterase family protein [Geomicrobium sediminis]|uniref:Nuclease SbcCD subunit D n=1 Tax=Geomicrobium sediminis TaxID=1347788 RepID=A0ABS2PEP5_9BACL|nr:exonuclease SbcCD subunit D C-terminal domain-containing protein [Geomicrobium sediminis]MBM7633441.1 exonuclease SbcD [Geomicrobium sediminis]
MRLLHTADWHFGRTLEGRDRTSEHVAFIDELVNIADEEAVDAVLIAGDVYDSSNPPAVAEELYYESLSRLSDGGKRAVAVIAGNHDQPERLAAARPLIRNERIHMLGLPDEAPMSIWIPAHSETLNIAALPYPSESRLKISFTETGESVTEDVAYQQTYDQRIRELFNKLSKSFSTNDVNVAMSHIYVSGGASTDSERPIEVGGAYTVKPQSLPSNVSYTALGHLHRPQWVHHAPTPTRYSGSPLAFSFNDTAVSKSVTIVDAKPSTEATIKEVPLSSGKPLVKVRAKNGLEEVYKWLEEANKLDEWVDLSIHSDHTLKPDDIGKIRRAHPGIVTIRAVLPEESMHHYEERKDVPIDELFRQFYVKRTGGAEPEQEVMQLFLSLLDDESTEHRKAEPS